MSLDRRLKEIVSEEIDRVLEALQELRSDLKSAGDASASAARAPDEMLSTAQAAELMGVTRATIRAWVHSGRLTAYGTPRALRIRRGDVLAMRPDADSPCDVQTRAAEIVHLHGR